MSAEKKFSSEVSDLPPFVTPGKSEEASSSGRVNINILLNRARKVRQKEIRTNLILFGFAASLIFIIGLILSF